MEIDDLLYQDIEEVHALTSLVFEESHDIKEIKDLYMKLHDDKEHYRFLVAKQAYQYISPMPNVKNPDFLPMPPGFVSGIP